MVGVSRLGRAARVAFAVAVTVVAATALAAAASPASAFSPWQHGGATVCAASGCHANNHQNGSAPSDLACTSCHVGGFKTPKITYTQYCWDCHTPGQDPIATWQTSAGCTGTCHLAVNPSGDECEVCHYAARHDLVFSHGAKPHAGADSAPCTTCHAVSKSATDPGNSSHHGGTLPNISDCASCHNGAQASLKVTHAGSATTCATCHNGMDKPPTPATCNKCHPASQVGTGNCTDSSCHGTAVIHTATPSAVSTCTTCHTGKATGHYTGLGTCTTCHRDVAGYHHQGKHTTPLAQCTTCHDGKTASAKVPHDGLTDCQSCHTGMDKPPVPMTCNKCHTTAQVGAGNCVASGCHATTVIHTATPSAVADCTSCHQDKASGHFAGLGACRTCHADVVGYHHQGNKAIPLAQCTTCHDGTIASARVSHDGIQQCSFCHNGMNRPTQAITCRQCHFRTAGLPADIVCTQCHGKTGVFGREQVHSSAPTSGEVCADCHQPHYADIGICATCHAQADQVHHGITPLLRSSMTLAAGPSTVTFGGGTILTGLLTNGVAPLPGETVTIQAEAAGAIAFAPLGTATTGPDGGFSLGVTPRATTTYRAYWVGRGQSTEVLGPTVMTVVVGVRPVVTIKLAGAAGKSGQYSRFPFGRGVGVSGAVQPNHAKLGGGSRPGTVTLVVERQIGSGAKWVGAARSTRVLAAASTFSWSWKPRVRGVYRMVASFPGDADHLAAQSLIVFLKVY